MGHISTLAQELRTTSVRRGAHTWGTLALSGGSVSVSHHGGAVSKAGIRGAIGDLSDRSRRRLMFALAAVEWPDTEYALLTLTYPGEWDRDPDVWRAHLEAFRARWERRFGEMRAVWVLEFQRRGAPHWHLVVALPRTRVELLRRWVSLSWYEVVGSGDARHLAAGTQVKHADGPRGAASYLFREMGKRSQKVLPDYVQGAGRWWGIWRLGRDVQTVDLTESEFHMVRRVLRRLAAARGYRADLSRRQGVTVLEGAGYYDSDREWHTRPGWGLASTIAAWVGSLRASGNSTRAKVFSPQPA